MSEQPDRSIFRMVVIVQVLLFFETIVLAFKPIHTPYRRFRWIIVDGIAIYHLIGFTILIIFALLLLLSVKRRGAANNLVFFTVAIFAAAGMFLWSTIADSNAVVQFDAITQADINANSQDVYNHDKIWFMLMAIFVFFLYLSIEAQRTDRPPLWRVVTVSIGTATPFFMALVSLMETPDPSLPIPERYNSINFVSGSPPTALISRILLFIFGLLFVTWLGVVTYYRMLRNVRAPELITPSKIQFASLLGLSEGLIIFSVDFSIGGVTGTRPLDVQYPLILITFLPPLMFLYWKNPSYISTLSTPVYELLVINDKGVTQLEYDFDDEDDPEDEGRGILKGGILSALTSIFQEITGTKSGIDKVVLEDRNILIEKIEFQERTWVVALIILDSNVMIRNSLKAFMSLLEQLFQRLAVENPKQLDYLELPSMEKEIRSIFY